MKEIALIVCIGPDNVIGIDNKLPWNSKQDFYHLKKQTMGYPCIFGDKTFDSLKYKPLKNRLNIRASLDCKETEVCDISTVSSEGIVKKGLYINVPSIEKGIELCNNYDKVFICGGAAIYKYCIEKNLINTIYLTQIISPTLDKQIKENPALYVRFPLNILDIIRNNWVRVPFKYEKDELPEENEDIAVLFKKWYRI